MQARKVEYARKEVAAPGNVIENIRIKLACLDNGQVLPVFFPGCNLARNTLQKLWSWNLVTIATEALHSSLLDLLPLFSHLPRNAAWQRY